MANTIFTQTITCLAVGKYPASNVDHPIHPLQFNSKLKHNNRFSVPEKNLALRFQNGSTRKMERSRDGKIWIVGTIFTILVSFTRGKWGPLLQLKEKVETTIDEAQRVVDIVEDVAEGVDKVAEEAVKHLPDGKLRDAVEFVEKVAEDIDKHAERAEDELEKVENMENEFESFIESTTHHQENSVTTTAEAKEQK
ncbi:hypothetical protein GLYMA_14G177800v4 [Glycine max]|uniref:Uncharacterized protein n=1 Tax=Glycine max TaxID=3847 RepID=A0A0R0GPA5_SOYBN|nr:hypothetical protein GLYMA_14G177800v4 [Glycine max]